MKNKMSYAEALHGILAFIPGEQVLAKGIQLKMAIQNGLLEVR